jgi:hypothetical protein
MGTLLVMNNCVIRALTAAHTPTHTHTHTHMHTRTYVRTFTQAWVVRSCICWRSPFNFTASCWRLAVTLHSHAVNTLIADCRFLYTVPSLPPSDLRPFSILYSYQQQMDGWEALNFPNGKKRIWTFPGRFRCFWLLLWSYKSSQVIVVPTVIAAEVVLCTANRVSSTEDSLYGHTCWLIELLT